MVDTNKLLDGCTVWHEIFAEVYFCGLKIFFSVSWKLIFAPRTHWFFSTSSPGRFSLALGAGREKALASAGHMTTKHPAFVGVIN